uniref:Uncharacterized protein n=1 Tax=Arundo donax TaxID=35708 RepID=A0A0A9CD54_ARUDO
MGKGTTKSTRQGTM